MGRIWPAGHSLPTPGPEYSDYIIQTDPFSDLLEDNWTHFPSWEVEAHPAWLHPLLPSSKFPVILSSNLVKCSLFLKVGWLCLSFNIVLQRAQGLQGRWEISPNAFSLWHKDIKLKWCECIVKFFGEFTNDWSYFSINTTPWVQLAFTH